MFKKVSRKRVFSILLAVFVVFASVPFAVAEYVNFETYSVFQNNEEYYYHTNGDCFIRNGSGGTNGNGRLNAKLEFSDNRFMLTENNQKFVFEQHLWMQQSWYLDDHNIHFNGLTLYYDGTVYDGESDDSVLVENRPATGEVHTKELVDNHSLNVVWAPDPEAPTTTTQEAWDNNVHEEGQLPAYDFEADKVNFAGNPQYYYVATVSFETNEAIDTNFYYDFDWTRGTQRHTLVEVNIVVTDVRELISKVDEYKEIIANPEGYSPEQIEQYQKYIDSVPEGMLEGTTYYTQEQVDTVYDYITGLIDGFADTEEYMYYRLKALDIISKDADGNYVNTDVYTSDSLSAFETQFKSIDIGAYFPYPVSRQAEVDEATANLKASFNYLAGANASTQTSDGTTTDTIWESSVDKSSDDVTNERLKASLTNTSYKFVQVNDSQPFTFSQLLYAEAQNVSWYSTSKPTITSFIFDETACANATNCSFDEETLVANNTTEFINHLDTSAKTTTDGITNYAGWFYNSRSGDYDKSFNITNGVINSTEITADTAAFGSTTYHYYYADANVVFSGNSEEKDENGNRISRDSEIDLSFYWKMTSTLDGTEYHAHIPVEILITDVRPLIDIYDELYKFSNFSSEAENRAGYTAESVEAVKNALASVPNDMVYGTSYYTQEEVNSYYNALLSAKNSLESTERADYTNLDSAIVNAEALLNGETIYTDATKTVLETAIAEAKAIERKLSADKQGIIDLATSDITNAVSSLKIKADYTEYDKLKAELDEIINAGNNGSHTDEEWQSFVDSVTSIDENLNKDLSDENQATVDSAVEQLKNVKEVYEGRQTADYTALELAIKNAENILNDTTTVYTNSSKAELEKVYDSAVALDKNLSVSEQATVDAMVAELEAAISGVKEKADYTALDKAIKEAEEALSKTDVTYTSGTKQALENALNLKESISIDLSTDEQSEIDSVTEAIINATTNLTEAADTSAYEEALENAKEIISGGNENERYDDSDWESFIDSVTKAEESVGENPDDIPKSEQEKVDAAKESLIGATTELYNKRYIFVEFRNESNSVFANYRIKYKDGLTFNDLESVPAIPESDSLKKYVGWYYIDGTTMTLNDAITEDVVLFCIEEEIKIVTKAQSGAEIDENNAFLRGLDHGTTVNELLASLDNDLNYIRVKDKDGNIVEADAIIATGMTVELVSKSDNAIKNDVITVVVMCDINGDGLVNDDDFNKSIDMCLKNTFYDESEGAFFAANDVDGDGVLDVIDLFFISHVRFGN